jgi:hypothetical protein
MLQLTQKTGPLSLHQHRKVRASAVLKLRWAIYSSVHLKVPIMKYFGGLVKSGFYDGKHSSVILRELSGWNPLSKDPVKGTLWKWRIKTRLNLMIPHKRGPYRRCCFQGIPMVQSHLILSDHQLDRSTPGDMCRRHGCCGQNLGFSC